MLQKSSLILLLSILAAFASGCSTQKSYRGAAIEGRVIDAQTRQPIQGVVVVADWQLYGRTFHPDIIGRLLLQETTTDANGVYRLPAWGPLRAKEGVIDRGSPALNFYKRGYRFSRLYNMGYAAPYIKLPDPLISEWSHRDVELEPHTASYKFGDSFQEFASAIGLLSLREGEECSWEQMPRMTAALVNREMEYLERESTANLPRIETLHQSGRCANPAEALKGYLDEPGARVKERQSTESAL